METKEIQKLQETTELDAKGKETLLALLTHKTKTKAAEALGIGDRTLYDRIDKYGLDKFIAELPTRALQQLQLGSIRAAEVMVEGLERHGDRMEAAKEILDRTGVTKKDPKTQVNIAGGDMSIEFVALEK